MTFEWDINETYVAKSICEVDNFTMSITDIKNNGQPFHIAQVDYKDRVLLLEGSIRSFETAKKKCEKCLVDLINECVQIANRYEEEKLRKELEGL